MAKATKNYAKRLDVLPPYLFAQIDTLKAEKEAQGIDVIDFGVGDPDQPTPSRIVDSLVRAAHSNANHRYPSSEGMLRFREAVCAWYAKKGIALDPTREVTALIGSKDGIAHLPLAFVNPGDKVLVPDPGYPVYRIATIIADGKPLGMPLSAENGFLPAIDKAATDAKLLFINYPNNPTAAVADRDFFRAVVDFAADNDIIVCHDAAYLELTYDGYEAPSFLSVPGAIDVGIEINSLSKTYNMTGWRIGFAVGNVDVIAGLRKVKSNLDSGAFQAVQEAGIAAMTGPQGGVEALKKLYEKRRDVLVDGLRSIGWSVDKPKATFYVWAPVPDGSSSLEFSMRLLNVGIVAAPGIGFGDCGEGYMRFALTVPISTIEEAVTRLEGVT
ncbi:MAG TPA: LL-diaminopimelate aminotransferase [Candidatus Bathyarchaeia archaeon]|nr:LL-diaminopimelate aminotransferase [Candidatus Bathyarchaeia archaeon]